jgi:acyl-CoA thioester hydrolase
VIVKFRPLREKTLGKVHETSIQVRFCDTDAIGHVNNACFANYAEVGRLEFAKAAGQEVTALILARLAIDFRAQINLGDSVLVRTWVERIGRSSITMKQTILTNGEIAADVGAVVVYFDYAANRPRELPAEQKKPLEQYLPDMAETE